MIASDSYVTTGQLRTLGITKRRLAQLVRDGELIRVRTGRFVHPSLDSELVTVARLGVRLDCVSLLRMVGVFVQSHERTHVQASRGFSRLPPRPDGFVSHWRSTSFAEEQLVTDLVEALAQACRCQPPREAVATLDSAWHLGLIDEASLAAVFARLPGRYQSLRPLLDRRSESGPETLMRLILRALGCQVDLQVEIPGVGRVDFVVDGWLIIECDSEAHHAGWASQRRDRRRDLAAAALGFTTIRPLAEDIMFHRDLIITAIRDVIASRC